MTSYPRILFILGILLIALGIAMMYMPKESVEAPGPTPIVEPGWETYTNDSLSFRYPPELSTTYVHPVEWPPQVSAVEGETPCATGTSERGETKAVQIQGGTYCVTAQSEGAAGSIYIDYAYSTQKEGRTVSLSFTLRMLQCANYDDPQRTECEQERTSFSADNLADRILQTVEFK